MAKPSHVAVPPSQVAANGVRSAYVVLGATSGVLEGCCGVCKQILLWAPSAVSQQAGHASAIAGRALERAVAGAYELSGVGSGLVEGGVLAAKTAVLGRHAGELPRSSSDSSVGDGYTSPERTSADERSSGYSSPEHVSDDLANGKHALANGNGHHASAIDGLAAGINVNGTAVPKAKANGRHARSGKGGRSKASRR